MSDTFHSLLDNRQIEMLSAIVQTGRSVASELLENPVYDHSFLGPMRGRLYTTCVQMQCELESQTPGFPFRYSETKFPFNQTIPQLATEGLIIHLGRSAHPDELPCKAKYKTRLSYNNQPLLRQMTFDFERNPPYVDSKFYGLLAFGGKEDPFAVLQFPEPGYGGIAEIITIPESCRPEKYDEHVFERKKAVLKESVLRKYEEEAAT